MRKSKRNCALACLLALLCLAGCGGEPKADKQVAGESDMATPVDLDTQGLTPVSGEELLDGEYDIQVDSSSSMFSIEACTLTVQDGEMTATMTMGGTGYLYVYMGTGEEAAAAEESAYIPFTENADGSHSFIVPVEALDQELSCAAFSKKKELWYDRTLVFRADELPAQAYQTPKEQVTVQSLALEDGAYTVEVSLNGGSGRASVTSPAVVKVEQGAATVTLEWGSANYDYMLVEGEKYLPVNTQGNSTFEVPLICFDAPVKVIADTVAMSTAHEIEYTLTFAAESLQAAA